jgi:hypothetical protein
MEIHKNNCKLLSNSILPNKQQYLWLLWLDHAVLLVLNYCFKNNDTIGDFVHSVYVINCDILGKLFLTGGGWNFSSPEWKLDLHWSCSWNGPRKSDGINTEYMRERRCFFNKTSLFYSPPFHIFFSVLLIYFTHVYYCPLHIFIVFIYYLYFIIFILHFVYIWSTTRGTW